MRKNEILYFFLLILITGCHIDIPCKGSNMVCRDAFNSVFLIISKDNGSDLVFGTKSIYPPSNIKIYSHQGQDTVFADYLPERLVLDGYDSVLRFKITAEVDTLYLKLNSFEIDTISVSYGLSEGRCCSFNSIRTLDFNNTGPLPNFNGTVVFKK